MAVSFDLFGTLVDHEQPAAPAVEIGEALEARGIPTPPDWQGAFEEAHLSVPAGAEVPLPVHVGAALDSRGVEFAPHTVRAAILAALDPVVEPREGAHDAVAAAQSVGPVAICSNCSLPELVGLSLERAGFSRERFDAFVTSAGCGWRKPAPEIFETTAHRLDVTPRQLVHVGDDPDADGGISDIGGRAVILEDRPLEEVAEVVTDLV